MSDQITCDVCLKGKHIGCRGCACVMCNPNSRSPRRSGSRTATTRTARPSKPARPERRGLPEVMQQAILDGLIRDGLSEKDCAQRAGCTPAVVRRIYDEHRYAHLGRT